jgi:hypothetical protein
LTECLAAHLSSSKILYTFDLRLQGNSCYPWSEDGLMLDFPQDMGYYGFYDAGDVISQLQRPLKPVGVI